MMLEKSNEMGSELAVLMKELDRGNRQAMVSLAEQEMLLKGKDELFDKWEECLLMEILVKDFELVVLSSELMQMSSTCISLTEGLENFKKDVIFKSIEVSSNKLILTEEFKMEETALYLNTQNLKDDMCILEKELQTNLVKKNDELGKMKCIEEENKILKGQFEEHKKENCVLSQLAYFTTRPVALYIVCTMNSEMITFTQTYIQQIDINQPIEMSYQRSYYYYVLCAVAGLMLLLAVNNVQAQGDGCGEEVTRQIKLANECVRDENLLDSTSPGHRCCDKLKDLNINCVCTPEVDDDGKESTESNVNSLLPQTFPTLGVCDIRPCPDKE